jgi:DNA-directed RNA polymerase subunit RPC12/RpoP
MFKCQECGRKFKTVRSAEKASKDGCPGCGGVDIDLDDFGLPTWKSVKTTSAHSDVPDGGIRCPECNSRDGYSNSDCPRCGAIVR